MKRPVVARALVAMALACGLLAQAPGAAHAQVPDVETKYEARGPWALAVSIDDTTLDGYSIYRPTVFGSQPNGQAYDHPVITWGVGTSSDPGCATGTALPSRSYVKLFELYASWGFVVVASDDCWVGTGAEQVFGASAMVWMNAAPGTAYTGKLASDKIAAVGHSQGAVGSIEAGKTSSLIKTVVTFALPTEGTWDFACAWKPAEQEPCVANIDASTLTRPTFLVSGSEDWLLSPHPASVEAYNEIPAGVAKAKADEKQVYDAAVTAANYPLNGQNSHVPDGHNYVPAVGRGYSLAWLFYRLYNDPAARPAFVGAQPQIATNPDWQFWASASLT
jgi:hypothetical protein